MDKITDAELLLRQAKDLLATVEEMSEDEAWLYLELGMILHDIQVIRERHALREGKFLIKDIKEIN